MNYIETVKTKLASHIDVEDDLLELYALLVLTRGQLCSLKDVHDAWAIWRNRTKPDHKSLVPFDELTQEVQQLDKEYTDAIIKTAQILDV